MAHRRRPAAGADRRRHLGCRDGPPATLTRRGRCRASACGRGELVVILGRLRSGLPACPSLLVGLTGLLLAATGCAVIKNRAITDSIGVQAEAQIHTLVPDSHADTAVARSLVRPGWKWDRQVTTGMEAIALHAPLVPHDGWLIIQLGANDVEFDPPSSWRTNVRAALGLIAPETCVAWVLPSNGRTPTMATRSTEFSDVVVEELRQRQCAAVIDWRTWVRVWPDLLLEDRLHVTVAGQHVLAWLIRAAVDRPRGNHVPPPTTTAPPPPEGF